MGLDVDQFHADFCLGHRAVGEQVDQAVFLGVELFQLTVEVGVSVADGGVFVGDDFFEEPSGLGGEGCRELQCAIVLGHGLCDHFDWEVGEIA
ncbi:hypothetical protein [Nocardia sp. NPDC004123]